MSVIRVNDELKQRDASLLGSTPQFSLDPHRGFRTEIEAIDDFGNKLFTTSNRLVLGGALFTLEKLFGVQAGVTVDYLNNIMGIATGGTNITDIYPKDTIVCLFGLGTGGAGDTITSVYDVATKEREVFQPIPFRFATALTAEEKNKYYFAKPDVPSGKTAYYLKKFESAPQIKVLWDDGVGDEDGTPVQTGVHSSSRTDEIESFVELTLRVDKNDCREWFEANGQIERSRFNSIGLFTGILTDVGSGVMDYKQVKLFSKFNINNEMLTLSKGLTIIYRIYTT